MNRLTVPQRILAVAGVLLVAGLVWGFWPMERGTAKCGSGLAGPAPVTAFDQEIDGLRSEAGVYDVAGDAACADARESAKAVSLVLIGAGVAGLVGGWVMSGTAGRSSSDDDGEVTSP